MTKHIMIVDDSASVRQLLSMALSHAGYHVIAAVDGKDAMDKLAEPVHMFITDMHMPHMNGVDLIRALRQRPEYAFTPIVMLTTESQTQIKQEGKAAGATGWIVKPFQSEQLLAVVQKLLR
ncbi:MAG: response regulator [Desulfovibrionaceae bacterium]